MRAIWRWFCCSVLGDHAWTCLAEQGIPPTIPDGDLLAGFLDYAIPYCEHCGKRMRR